MSKHFDAVIAKNDIAKILRDIEHGEYEDLGELPLRQLWFSLREIEIYSGVMNQPAIIDIKESECRL